MAETKNENATQSAQQETSESPFAEALAKTGLPPTATDMMRVKFDEAFNLIQQNNARVLQINQAKAADPNNVENLDSIWRTNPENDARIAEIEPRYQELIAESEKILAEMRDLAKKQIKPPLSEEAVRDMRKLVNESKPTVTTALEGAKVYADMADAMLKQSGNEIQGGILSLMPPIESLLNARGRKAGSKSTGEKVTYATRAGDLLLNGKKIEREVSGTMTARWAFVADELNKMWDAEKFPQNGVTGDDIEKEFYAAIGQDFRDKSNLPSEKEFTFTKDVTRVGANGEASAPESVNILFRKWTPAPKDETESKTETADDKPNEAPVNEAPAEKVNAPAAKKTAPPAKK